MTAKKQKTFYTYFLTRLSVLVILLLTIININKIFENKKVLGVQIDTNSVNQQKIYYDNLVKQNPTYMDGYIELAKISSFLGDRESEKNYLKLAYNINPNSKEIKDLLAQIGE